MSVQSDSEGVKNVIFGRFLTPVAVDGNIISIQRIYVLCVSALLEY